MLEKNAFNKQRDKSKWLGKIFVTFNYISTELILLAHIRINSFNK